jgi:hydrogenase nickel incorporation protein HypA/HybF
VCRGIIEIAIEALGAPDGPAPIVTEVRVEIGRLAGVDAESLRFCFEALIPRTPLAGARLDIELVPIRARCVVCETRFEIDALAFRCPACESGRVELTSGRELRVVSLDTAEEVPRASASGP